MIIAIDGPAGAGKSTTARLLAKRLGFLYIDTGAMYRALTVKALEQKIDLTDHQALSCLARNTEIALDTDSQGAGRVFLDGRDVSVAIRDPRITAHVSDVAKVAGVREVMVELQRKLGKSRDSVMDGRDIGTVVFPDADRKFYLDARPEERANRRYKELKESGKTVKVEDVAADLSNRDRIDSTRECAPLKRAADAIYIDTTPLGINEVVEEMFRQCRINL